MNRSWSPKLLSLIYRFSNSVQFFESDHLNLKWRIMQIFHLGKSLKNIYRSSWLPKKSKNRDYWLQRLGSPLWVKALLSYESPMSKITRWMILSPNCQLHPQIIATGCGYKVNANSVADVDGVFACHKVQQQKSLSCILKTETLKHLMCFSSFTQKLPQSSSQIRGKFCTKFTESLAISARMHQTLVALLFTRLPERKKHHFLQFDKVWKSLRCLGKYTFLAIIPIKCCFFLFGDMSVDGYLFTKIGNNFKSFEIHRRKVLCTFNSFNF